MNEEDKKEIQEAWQDAMGSSVPAEFGDAFLEHTGKLFVNVWGRPGLGRRERRITTLTAIATGGAGSGVLEYHIKAAVQKQDLTIDELIEWATHLAYYGGWPVGAEAYAAVNKVKGELEQ